MQLPYDHGPAPHNPTRLRLSVQALLVSQLIYSARQKYVNAVIDKNKINKHVYEQLSASLIVKHYHFLCSFLVGHSYPVNDIYIRVIHASIDI